MGEKVVCSIVTISRYLSVTTTKMLQSFVIVSDTTKDLIATTIFPSQLPVNVKLIMVDVIIIAPKQSAAIHVLVTLDTLLGMMDTRV